MKTLKTILTALAVAAPLTGLAACQSNGPQGCPDWKADFSAVARDATAVREDATFGSDSMNAAAYLKNDAENAAYCTPPGSASYQKTYSESMNAYANAASDYLDKDYSGYVREYGKAQRLLSQIVGKGIG